jgi:hypothetical protein
MMSVCLIARPDVADIDLPRFIPIVDSPLSVFNIEVLLKALADPPLHRLVPHYEAVM